MSLILNTLGCDACGKFMNVMWGMQGMAQIGGHPRECRFCKSDKLRAAGRGWHADSDGNWTDDAFGRQITDRS